MALLACYAWRASCMVVGMTIDTDKMRRAFNLVDPSVIFSELVARGLFKAGAAPAWTWKDRIGALVTDEDLAAADVTIDDVREAVEHFTATEAQVTRAQIEGRAWVHFLEARPGYMVQAVGYNAGPAGDG